MRCFVAAWPDEPTRLALATLSRDIRPRVLHRRATQVGDLHLTVAFIGHLDAAVAFEATELIAALTFAPFTWQLDKLGFFEPARVVWIGSESRTVSKPLSNLAHQTHRALEPLDIDFERRPLVPHVSLLHGVTRFGPERVTPIIWRIDAIALYRSTGNRAGPRYVRVRG